MLILGNFRLGLPRKQPKTALSARQRRKFFKNGLLKHPKNGWKNLPAGCAGWAGMELFHPTLGGGGGSAGWKKAAGWPKKKAAG